MPDRYASNNHDAYTPPPCGRCGKPLPVEWVDDTRTGDASPWDRPVPLMCPCRYTCQRCGQVGLVDWIDVGTYGDRDQVIPGRSWCETPGCVDEYGSSRVPIAEAP